MFPSPEPPPSEALYGTVNVHVFSYAGSAFACDVGGVLSSITNGSVCDVAMSTVRGSFAKVWVL